MRVLVTGAAGQLAYAVCTQMRASQHDVVALTRDELDLTRGDDVVRAVRRIEPDLIINGAAYNNVDGAEDDPRTAIAVNALGVRTLAKAAADTDATLVHYSTDFVFDGTATTPYTEDMAPNPQSVYAMSKLLGEWFARDAKHYVLRVESLFGGALQPIDGGQPRGSSLDRMADGILAGREIRAFEDRTVSPSYVDDVARATDALVQASPSGLYHCVGTGMATWLEVVRELARQLGRPAQIVPVSMASVGMKARRPQFCALSNARLAALGIEMPSWQDAVARYAQGRLAGGGR